MTSEFSIQPSNKWNVFAKASYSRNNTTDSADECVWAGTDGGIIGGGVEFYPLPGGNKSMRLHAAYNYGFGDNMNPNGIFQKEQHFMSVGMLWRMDLVNLVSSILKKSHK